MAAPAFSSALELVERCHTISDINVVIEDFRAFIAGYGFNASITGAWTGPAQQQLHRFYFNNWPEEWLNIYMQRGFYEVDPFVEESRRSMVPFLYSEIAGSRPLTARGKEVYAAVAEFGWREVFGVPIHGPAGYRGPVSLAAMTDVKLSFADRGCLETACRAIHERCRREIGFGIAPEDLPRLTAREVECMRWVALGKTDWEISQVLGISASTVHFHVESAKRKVSVGSRTEAVARLTLYGLI